MGNYCFFKKNLYNNIDLIKKKRKRNNYLYEDKIEISIIDEYDENKIY
jgi:hypothetical protein